MWSRIFPSRQLRRRQVPSQARSASASRNHRRLAFEGLEDRALLATFNWVAAGDGNWAVASNWVNTTTNMPGIPGAADHANLNGNITVTSASSRTVNALGGNGQLHITGGTLTVRNVADSTLLFGLVLDAGATLRTTGGTTAVIGAEISGTVETTGLGTFRLERGLMDLNPGASLTGDGQYLMAGDVFGGPFVNLLTDITAPQNFLFRNGEIGGPKNLTIAGTFDWTTDGFGMMSGTGQTIVLAGAALNIDGSATRVDTRTLVNQGTINFAASNNLNLAGNAVVDNQGLFDFQNDTDLDTANGPTQATFNNSGTIRKSGGLGLTALVTTLQNTGSVDVQTGDFSLFGGDTAGGTFTLAAGSTFDLTSGQAFELNGAVNFLGSGVILTGAGLLNIGGAGATLSVPATSSLQMQGGVLTIPIGAQLTVNGNLNLSVATSAILRGGGKLQVNGTFFHDGAGSLFVNGDVATNSIPTTIVIPASRSYAFRGDGDVINTGGAGGIIVNNGLLRKLSGTGLSDIQVAVINTKTIRADAGTLALRTTSGTAGTLMASPGAVLQINDNGGGAFTESGTLTVSGGGAVELSTGQFFAGASGAAINVASATTFRWSGGTFAVPVGQTLAINGAMEVTANTTVNVYGGGKFRLNGNILQSGNGPLRIDGNGTSTATTLEIPVGKTFEFSSDGSLLQGNGGGGIINNLGTIRKSGGVGTSLISASLAQAANLTVNSGTLQLQPAGGVVLGGQFNVDAGAILLLNTGFTNTTMSGNFTGSGAGEIRSIGGIIAEGGGPGVTFSFPAGLFRIQGGSIDTNGKSVTIATEATFSGATPLRLFGGGELEVLGEFNHTSTERIDMFGGATLHIATTGAYHFKSDGDVTVNGAGAVVNEGLLNKVQGTGESLIAAPFSNQGTVEARRGTLRISGAVSEIVAGELTGGKWAAISTASNAATLNLGTAVTRIGLEATVTSTGPNSSLPSFASLAEIAGTFNLLGDASFAVSGNLTNLGTVTLSKASVLSVVGTFAQTALGKLNLQMNNAAIGKISAAGAVTLGGQLNVTFTGTPPAIGTNVFILENSGVGTTTGTFAGLAQNALINIGAMQWRISYLAGPGGNDVRLTRIS